MKPAVSITPATPSRYAEQVSCWARSAELHCSYSHRVVPGFRLCKSAVDQHCKRDAGGDYRLMLHRVIGKRFFAFNSDIQCAHDHAVG